MRAEIACLAGQLNSLKRQREEERNEAIHNTVASYTLSVNANEYMRSRVQRQQELLCGAHAALADKMVRAV